LNGAPLFLTGFNRHEDSPATAMAADLSTARRDLVRMKQAGANFVRLCHYPHHPQELDLCDELGLLVMDEIPLYWLASRADHPEALREKSDAAREQLSRLIARDRNHPSVIFWSISNETNEREAPVRETNDELLRLAKSLDHTRLAVHVSSAWPHTPHFDADDVIAINGYPNVWPWAAPPKDSRLPKAVLSSPLGRGLAASQAAWREALAKLHALYPAKPILISEFGYPSILGEKDGQWGEGAAAQVLDAEFHAFDAPYVCGATVWCFADHPWPPGQFLGGLGLSPFGVVSRDRHDKAAIGTLSRLFHARHKRYGEEANAVLPEGDNNIIMILPDLKHLPELTFPEGYGCRGMRPGDETLWADIWRETEPPIRVEDDLFAKQFGTDWQRIGERCFLVTDPRQCAIGTISAWFDASFQGADWGRIHWVAIRPAHQGKGLAKPALVFALRKLAQWHERAYLVTQAFRLPAVKTYLDLGFRPDLSDPAKLPFWRYLREALRHPALSHVP
jgi:GNAT superfamily N-acetyltransferase